MENLKSVQKFSSTEVTTSTNQDENTPKDAGKDDLKDDLVSSSAGAAERHSSKGETTEGENTNVRATEAERELMEAKQSNFHVVEPSRPSETTGQEAKSSRILVDYVGVPMSIAKGVPRSSEESTADSGRRESEDDALEPDGPSSGILSSDAQPQQTEATGVSSAGAYAMMPTGVRPDTIFQDSSESRLTDADADIEQGNREGEPVGAVTARVVSDDALRAEIQLETEAEIRQKILDEAVTATSVQQHDLEEGEQTHERSARQRFGLLLTGAMILVVILVVVLLALLLPNRDSNKESENNVRPDENETIELRTKEEFLLELLLPISGRSNLQNESSPCFEALQWLSREDQLTNRLILGNDDLSALPESQQEGYIATLPQLDADPNNVFLVERYLLALLYFSTGGREHWTAQHDFLNVSSPVCQWPPLEEGEAEEADGVRCDGEGRVNKIRFLSYDFFGTIPTELSALSHLEVLFIADMSLFGPIPSELGTLSRMRSLVLAHNHLTGTIPEDLARLTNLELLYLFVNEISGTIPPAISKISMKEFKLDGCLLTGAIPPFLDFSGMLEIHLQGNSFEGEFPSSITRLEALQELKISHNILSGTLSTSIAKLSNLWLFEANGNLLSGTIPGAIGDMRGLIELLLQNNRFQGEIPPEIGELQLLAVLDLGHNMLTGEIPSSLTNCRDLSQIVLPGNLLEGEVPLEFATFENFYGGGFLGINGNSITGSLDPIFCNRTELAPEIAADCAPRSLNGTETVELQCSCCSVCCDDVSHECSQDFAQMCENHISRLEATEGVEPACECQNGGFNYECSDPKCQSCSQDGNICATPIYGHSSEYNANNEEEGRHRYYHCSMQYVKGATELVSFQYDVEEQTCAVSVDGLPCNSCNPLSCASGFETWRVDCSNIEPSSVFYPCDPSTAGGGVLLASFNEEFMSSEDCTPCWHPI